MNLCINLKQIRDPYQNIDMDQKYDTIKPSKFLYERWFYGVAIAWV